MPHRERTRSPEYQRKWYWHQDPQTGWWTWYYHAYDWVPARQRGAKENAASSTSLETPPQETAGTGSENGQVVMKESKEKEAVVDMDIDGSTTVSLGMAISVLLNSTQNMANDFTLEIVPKVAVASVSRLKLQYPCSPFLKQ